MITKNNLKEVLLLLDYKDSGNNIFERYFSEIDCSIIVDFNEEKIKYPKEKGFKVNVETTTNFSEPENFVVLECVTHLLDKGYRAESIELERAWTLGHEQKSGRADICVSDAQGKMLFIVECKTYGAEYEKEKKNISADGGQLISYWQQERGCRWLVLYASNLNSSNQLEHSIDSIDCSDDDNIISLAKKDSSIKLYKDAHTVSELYYVWKETYEKRFCGDVIFRDDSVAYEIGVKPLRKKDLKDFTENGKIVNRFEEILRHNNVSDKENAFNRLVALFICKLVDEIQKSDNDIVEFQYKVGTDTYESLQDRFQRLHKEGMEKFMREEIFYVSDDYAENLVKQYTKQKRVKMIEELKNTLRILKFYTNNDFAFKDVHNEELFYQNGKILVEVVQLFQDYRIIGSSDIQMLGDLFEQLLNKGFKQNEGQFFTPTPITRFIWDSIPIEKIMKGIDGIEYPKIIDYACGAGHFLTEGYEAIDVMASHLGLEVKHNWVENKIFGIEKDYRLARVCKISLFMHGAGNGNIIFGDGLENYPDKSINVKSFDILVANPPYSVKAFKPHLKLVNNELSLLEKISNDGSEIETLFVERIAQLLKSGGIAAVILPSSILNKENESFVGAREILLQNFYVRAIVALGSKTFGATGTNTVILFLQKYDEPPKRVNLVSDSVSAIMNQENLEGWEDELIFRGYLKKIGVGKETYYSFISKKLNYTDWESDEYFGQYYVQYTKSSDYNTKLKQKSFSKLSEEKQLEWFNQRFYEYALSLEREKLLYFSLVYNQETLIISSPDENKEQEKFLGYKWSNRKGQEGIQIINPGGCLYNDQNRNDPDTIAGLIRNTFSDDNSCEVSDLESYYYRLRLQDMIDFSNTNFNKSIKTTPTRVLKNIPGLTNYRLSDKNIFDLSIGDRVLSEEVVEGGNIPIYSANVFEEFGRINKKNITDFSKPSILWGIDGDWMVNIIPANKQFYPTDHCGVLRIKTNDIIPEYMALALQVEGEFERFSRSNRASTQRIANLIIQVPSLSEQEKIVNEISTIDSKIEAEQAIIANQTESVKSKFVEMFELENFTEDEYTSKYSMMSIESICEDGRGRVISTDYILSHKGQYPVFSSQTTNQGIFGYIDTYDFEGEYITWTTDGANAGTIFYRNGRFNCTNVCGTLKAKDNSIVNMQYLAYILGKVAHKHVNHVGNDKLMNARMKKIIIPIPPKQLQDAFADFVESCDKLKFEAQERINKLTLERNVLIEKYFK